MNRFVSGLTAEGMMVITDSSKQHTIDGLIMTDTLSLTVTESERKHAVALQLQKPNCVYLYDCVFSHRFQTCFWSGRAVCILAEEE